MRIVSLAALLPILAAPWASATEVFQVGPEEILETRVNGQDEGVTLLVRRDANGALLVRTEDLAALRLKPSADGIVLVEGSAYASIGAAQGAQLSYDAATQSVELSLPPEAFVATVATQAVDGPGPATVSPGAFLNYDFSAQRVSGQDENGALVELGVFGRPGVVTHSMLAQNDAEHSGAIRLDTTWTLDLPNRLSTLRVGDAISTAGAWGQSMRFGGVQFGTNFATQPTLVTAPLLAASGEAVVPSTVDVFINGQRIATEPVPPGPFAIENLPGISGAGELQVVVTDALGRQQVITQPYYSAPSLLRAGLNEYSFEIGAVREDYALESFTYGELLAVGSFRRGFSEAFTAELRAEAQVDGARAIGIDTAWQVGTVGIVGATAAAGTNSEDTGWLAGLGFERTARRMHVFARTEYRSEGFVHIGIFATDSRQKQRSFAGVGLDLARFGSVQVAYGQQSYWGAESVQTLGLSYSNSLGNFGFLNLFANQTRDADTETEVYLSWTMPLRGRRTVGASLAYRPNADAGDSVELTGTVQQSLPVGSGTGYYLSASSSEDVQAYVSYQGRAGQAGVEYSRRGQTEGWRATALGGLTLTAAGVLPARWLEQSFAVVQVADFPDLTVYVENQAVGRTDQKGRVLLDGLRPYDSNQVSLDPNELPLDASLANTRVMLTPAWRSGTVVEFPIIRATAVTMRLVQEDGAPVPAGARVHASGGDTTVALNGLVYLTDARGYDAATASWPGHRCHFSFQRPDNGDPAPDLGQIACRGVTP